MIKRNARYEVFGRLFYNYLVLFETNKNVLGLRTYKNDKILLDYIRLTTNNSRKELYKYLKKNHINYIVFDNENNTKQIKFDDNNYYKFVNIAFITEILHNVEICYKRVDF